jgi:hypothetical protein
MLSTFIKSFLLLFCFGMWTTMFCCTLCLFGYSVLLSLVYEPVLVICHYQLGVIKYGFCWNLKLLMLKCIFKECSPSFIKFLYFFVSWLCSWFFLTDLLTMCRLFVLQWWTLATLCNFMLLARQMSRLKRMSGKFSFWIFVLC